MDLGLEGKSVLARLIPVLALLWVPLEVRAAGPEDGARLAVVGAVRLVEQNSPGRGREFKLLFESLPTDPTLGRLSVREVREVCTQLEGLYTSREPQREGERIGELHEALYGAAFLPLPWEWQESGWFQALLLSPRYMGEGVREAAEELFSSRTLVTYVCMSVVFYMAAWAAPEPVFTKSLAMAVTLGLLMTYSVAELHNVAVACLTLYREAGVARSRAQVEEAAEHFGKTIGGVGLRVLLTVATARLSPRLSELNKGSAWARLSPARFALPENSGGLLMGAGVQVQVSVADSTVVFMVATGTTAQAIAVAATAARTSGACREASDKGEAKEHHIATNKNNASEVRGGPWTPRFEDFFQQAGMGLDDPANKIHLIGHQGPHPKDYHQEVFRRLQRALRGCQSQGDCHQRLVEELNRLAEDICSPGSWLNTLVTRRP